MQNFSNGTIDGEKFVNQFNTLRRENVDACEMQETNLKNDMNFQPNPQSQGFTRIISDIHASIDFFDPDLDDFQLNMYVISEDGLRGFVEDYFIPKIYQYCNKY